MDNEKLFLDEIENIIKKKGFLTWREVIPNECKKWTLPYRVDMVVFSIQSGYIGIEAKYLNTYSQGAVIAQAVEQIKKYRVLHYFEKNRLITKWAVCLHHFEYVNERDNVWNIANKRVGLFVQSYLRFYNISWVEYNDTKDKIIIDSNTKEAFNV